MPVLTILKYFTLHDDNLVSLCMYKNKKIALVIRAFNEENFIPMVVNSVPDFVDRGYLVNDASTDKTFDIMCNFSQRDQRFVVISHNIRKGAGAAAITGMKQALRDDIDIVAIVDGDGQMFVSILDRFLDPLVSGNVDYVKGNRLSQREHRREMPIGRVFGNFMLTHLTRIASGYWHISDPQNGYTAISKQILEKINLDSIDKGFAFENDMLVKLKIAGARVANIPHQAIYRGQNSKIRYPSFVLNTSWLLLRDFTWRIYTQYFDGRIDHSNDKVNGH